VLPEGAQYIEDRDNYNLELPLAVAKTAGVLDIVP